MAISSNNFAIHYNTGASSWYKYVPASIAAPAPFAGPAPQVKRATARVVLEDGRVFRYDISGPCEGGVEIDSPNYYPVVSDPVILPDNPFMTAVFRFKRTTDGSGPFLVVTEEQAELDFGDE